VIDPADLQAVKDAIDVINEKLVPILIALTPEERRELAKMGDKTVAFVTKAVEYMQEYPELVPNYVPVEPAQIDLAAVKTLLPINSQFTKLEEMTSDSSMLSGSEAYGSALSFYNAVKLQAKENVPGAKNVYEDLKARFPGRGKKQE
jgi:hypothetical protein